MGCPRDILLVGRDELNNREDGCRDSGGWRMGGPPTTVANEGFAVVFGSVTDEAGHVLNPSIVFFAGVLLIFQEQEIDVMRSVTLRRKVFYAETILVFFVKTVDCLPLGVFVLSLREN